MPAGLDRSRKVEAAKIDGSRKVEKGEGGRQRARLETGSVAVSLALCDWRWRSKADRWAFS